MLTESQPILSIGAWLSATAAAFVGWRVAGKLGRRRLGWALACGLFIVPLIPLVQLRARSDFADSAPQHWKLRSLFALVLGCLALLLGEQHIKSAAVARLEAKVVQAWFSDAPIHVEGALISAPEATIELDGQLVGPLVVALIGSALGVLIVQRTSAALLGLGAMGLALGAVSQVWMHLVQVQAWLSAPLVTPPAVIYPVQVAFGGLLWVAILVVLRHGQAHAHGAGA